MDALTELGLQPRAPVDARDFADPRVRQAWISDKHMQVLCFYDPEDVAREVNVFVAYPLDFEMLTARAVPTRVGDRTVPVASLEHLIEMKSRAGRAQDLADIEALQRLRERSRGHER